uniref:CRM1_C domain-containing protein n=1 Tax=Globodera pallida TaxID=36090 RepID=A0A183CJZ8_GLOPA
MGPVGNYTHKTIQFVNMCLIKEYSDRPTFSDLMLSEFYKFFNAIPDKLEPVYTKLHTSNVVFGSRQELKGRVECFVHNFCVVEH